MTLCDAYEMLVVPDAAADDEIHHLLLTSHRLARGVDQTWHLPGSVLQSCAGSLQGWHGHVPGGSKAPAVVYRYRWLPYVDIRVARYAKIVAAYDQTGTRCQKLAIL